MRIDWLASSKRGTYVRVGTNSRTRRVFIFFMAAIRAFQRVNDRRLMAVVFEQRK